MTFYKWSQIAAADATADASINWQEGQAPSSINDSARAMMAAMAKYRDDISGSIATGGTSTAYTISSFQGFDSLSRLNGQTVAFTPHVSNGAAVTLNVDGLGAKPLRSAPSVELAAGTLVQGTPYTCVYNNSDQVFYLRDFYVNPYIVPIGSSVDYWGSSAPNSSFALAYGQAISRTTYATLFSLFGTTYGTGDGSTTFNIPDLRGRVVAGRDDMGGSSANRLTNADDGLNGDVLGATGGGETQTLFTGNLPPYTPGGTITNGAITINHNAAAINTGSAAGGSFGFAAQAASISASQAASTFTGTAQGGTSAAFGVVQPTIIANKLLRII